MRPSGRACDALSWILVRLDRCTWFDGCDRSSLSLPISRNLSLRESLPLSLSHSATGRTTQPIEIPDGTGIDILLLSHRIFVSVGGFTGPGPGVRHWDANATSPTTRKRKGTFGTRRTCRIGKGKRHRKRSVRKGTRSKAHDDEGWMRHPSSPTVVPTRVDGWIGTFRLSVPGRFLAWKPTDPSPEDEVRGKMVGSVLPFLEKKKKKQAMHPRRERRTPYVCIEKKGRSHVSTRRVRMRSTTTSRACSFTLAEKGRNGRSGTKRSFVCRSQIHDRISRAHVIERTR